MAVRKINAQTGQSYTVINAPGGTYHVYAGGRRVFVPAHQGFAQAAKPTAGAGLVKSAGLPAQAPRATQPAQQAAALTPDSTYFANQAQSTFDTSQQMAGYDAADARAKSDYTEALRQLSAQQPLDEQKSRESYNNQGLFYSGKMGEALNNLASSYASRKAQAAATLEQGNAARTAARQALQSGASVDQAAQLAASADRQINTDTTAADSNSLVADPAPKPAMPKPVTTVPRVRAIKPKVVRRPRRPRLGAVRAA